MVAAGPIVRPLRHWDRGASCSYPYTTGGVNLQTPSKAATHERTWRLPQMAGHVYQEWLPAGDCETTDPNAATLPNLARLIITDCSCTVYRQIARSQLVVIPRPVYVHQ